MLSKQDNEVLCRVGPGTPMGNLLRQYWMPGDPLGRAAVAGLPAGARQAAGRGAHRLPHDLRRRRPDAERLPAPRRLAVLRPQRRRRPALRLPRLEVRRRRRLRRHAVGAGREQLQEQGARAAPTPRTSAAASSGPTWARAKCRRRCRTSKPTCSAEEHRPITRAAPRQQLDAGLGGRDGHRPRRLPARRRHTRRGHRARHAAATTRSRTAPASSASRDTEFGTAYGAYRAGRGGQLLLAHRPHALPLLRHGAAGARWARGRASAPTCRWTTTTRCSGTCSRAPTTGAVSRASGDVRAAARTAGVDREYLPNGTGWFDRFNIDAEPGQRLPDRPRGAAQLGELHRHPRHPPAGHGGDREHGPDLRTAAASTSARRTR